MIEPIYRHIGAKIRQMRQLLDWKQEKVAKRCGLTRTSIANIEAGRQRILLHENRKSIRDITACAIERDVGLKLNVILMPKRQAVDILQSDLSGMVAEGHTLKLAFCVSRAFDVVSGLNINGRYARTTGSFDLCAQAVM